MKRIPIDEAEVGQLRAFASVHLGLELGGRENVPTLRAKIAEAGWAMAFINVEEAAPAASFHPSAERSGITTEPYERVVTWSDDKGNRIEVPDVRKVRIMIHTSDAPGGDQPVPVSVNGSVMYIPRGKAGWVPEHFVAALQNAVETVYPQYDGGEGGLGEPRQVPAYPFSYV